MSMSNEWQNYLSSMQDQMQQNMYLPTGMWIGSGGGGGVTSGCVTVSGFSPPVPQPDRRLLLLED